MTSQARSRSLLHRLRPSRGFSAALLVAVLLGAAACGAGEKGASSGSASAGTSSSKDVAAFKADLAARSGPITTYKAITPVTGDVASLRGKTVWYVPFGAAVPFLNAVGASITEALGALGVTVKVCDGKFQPSEVASCLDQAGQQGADGVITGYVDYQLVPNAFDALVAKHIPVLVAGAAPSAGKTSTAQLGFYNDEGTQLQTQRLLAESVIAASKGKAKVLYLTVNDSPQLVAAADAGQKFYADHCPGCTVTRTNFLSSASSKLGSLVSAGLVSHPDTTDVSLMLDANGGSVSSAIATAGKSGTVRFSAGGSALDSVQRVATGTQSVLIGNGPAYTGWRYADGMVRMLTGAAPVVITPPARVFTKANTAGLQLTPAAFASNAWYGSDAYKTTFTKAWGIK